MFGRRGPISPSPACRCQNEHPRKDAVYPSLTLCFPDSVMTETLAPFCLILLCLGLTQLALKKQHRCCGEPVGELQRLTTRRCHSSWGQYSLFFVLFFCPCLFDVSGLLCFILFCFEMGPKSRPRPASIIQSSASLCCLPSTFVATPSWSWKFNVAGLRSGDQAPHEPSPGRPAALVFTVGTGLCLSAAFFPSCMGEADVHSFTHGRVSVGFQLGFWGCAACRECITRAGFWLSTH